MPVPVTVVRSRPVKRWAIPRPGTIAGALLVTVVALVLLVPGAPVLGPHGASPPGPSTSDSSPATGSTDLPGGSDWATYLHDEERTAAVDEGFYVTPENDTLLGPDWSFATGGTIASQAIVVNGTVYFGSWDGFEYALGAATGQEEWSTFLGVHPALTCGGALGITSTATVTGSTLYVGGGSPRWYALSAATGHVLWSTNVSDDVQNLSGSTVPYADWEAGLYDWASPLVYNGEAYVGIASDCDVPLVPGGLLEISLSGADHNGTHFFLTTPSDALGGSVWSSPSVDPATNTVFIATGNPKAKNASLCASPCPYVESLIALNATTLVPLNHWQVPVPDESPDGDFGTTPTLVSYGAQTYVIVTNKNGWTYGFNALNATTDNPSWGPVWQTRTSKVPTTSSAAYADLAGRPLVLLGNNSGGVWALNATTGQTVWTRQFVGRVFGAPAVSNGVLVIAAGGTLHLLSAATGTESHTLAICSRPYFAAPTIAEGRVYEGCSDGTMYVFGVATGTLYAIGGRVVDSNGTAIYQATVAYSGSGHSGAVQTNGAGYFTVQLPNGTYTFTASASGYSSQTKTVTVSGQNRVAGQFVLNPSALAETYKVSGRVVNISGSPLSHATVSYVLDGAPGSVVANANGYFTVHLPNGTYTLTASAAGCSNLSKMVTVAGQNVVAGRFVLAPLGPTLTYKVTGRVVNASGDPIVDATISFQSDTTSSLVSTNGLGYFTAHLTNGTYQLTVAATGYTSQTKTVTVAGSDMFAGHFVLKT